MAKLAGFNSKLNINTEYISITFTSYNDKFESCIAEIFKKIQEFTVDEDYFKEMCERKLRAYKNSFTSEPFRRVGEL